MIPEFYENRQIFITGGSGVIGKALIDKLLRSCNVGTLYVLLRPKENATVEERLAQIKEDMIFRRLFKEKPNEFDEKVVAIPGDVTQPMMGITSNSQKLMHNVSIVFHGAATIRFDEPLRQAIQLNVGGTQEALKFAETLKHLQLFMYISTFYSNTYLKYVESKWYEAPMDWQVCLEMSRRNDIADETLEILARKLITGFPNTYCFTKNIAESLVNHYRTKLPVIIFRPTIVMFAIDDPEPGYPTSLTGAMAIFALAGAGLSKVLYSAKNQRCDFAALDIVIKCMLYYPLKAVEMFAIEKTPNAIPVFHVSSCTYTDLTIQEYVHIAQKHDIWSEVVFEKNLLLPGVIFTDSRFLYLVLVLFQQILPALLVDLILRLRGLQPMLLKTQRKIFVSMELLLPFLFNMYQSDGITCDQEMISALKRTDFHMDPVIGWNDYNLVVSSVRNTCYKIREVLFKEDPSTLPKSRRIMKIIFQLFLVYKLYHIVLSMITNYQWMDRRLFNGTDIF